MAVFLFYYDPHCTPNVKWRCILWMSDVDEGYIHNKSLRGTVGSATSYPMFTEGHIQGIQ